MAWVESFRIVEMMMMMFIGTETLVTQQTVCWLSKGNRFCSFIILGFQSPASVQGANVFAYAPDYPVIKDMHQLL
jgi:hypothetical protein